MQTLDTFTRAYLDTALWATLDETDPSGGEPLDKNHDISEFDPAALARIIDDCARFQADNAATLDAAISAGVRCGPDFDEMGRAGHDFFLTRHHHGAGFWDGDWPEPYAATLTANAEEYKEAEPYIGDDGKIYA